MRERTRMASMYFIGMPFKLQACSTCGACLILRGSSLILYNTVQKASESTGEGRGRASTHPEGSARQLWPATLTGPEAYAHGRGHGRKSQPRQHNITVREQTLCHFAGSGRYRSHALPSPLALLAYYLRMVSQKILS